VAAGGLAGLRRIAIICADFPPIQSGEAGHALHLARAMARRGLETHVLTSQITGHASDPTFTIHADMPSWSWSSLPRLVRFLRRTSPDAVVFLFLSTMYRSHAMMTFLPTIVRAVVPHAVTVTQFEHAGTEPHDHSLTHRIIRKGVATLIGSRSSSYEFGTLLRDSDQVIALNEPHRLALVEHWPPVTQRISTIPPPPLMRIVPPDGGRARERGRRMLGARDDEILLLYYGYIYPGKGVETLIDALQLVARAEPRVRLIVAGAILEHVFSGGPNSHSINYKSALHEQAARLGVADRITWTGATSPDGEEGSLYMWAADVCVLPFDRGIQLNNSTFSAAASHGLPVITTRGPLLETPFVHGDNVWLCEPRNPEALAAAMHTLVSQEPIRRVLGAGAHELATELFSWDAAVTRTLDLIQLSRSQRGSARRSA